MKRRQQGFTLVELLVVVAIIALLISILLPSLSTARELSRISVCASNLRGMTQTAIVYSSDWDGVLPPMWTGAPGTTNLQSTATVNWASGVSRPTVYGLLTERKESTQTTQYPNTTNGMIGGIPYSSKMTFCPTAYMADPGPTTLNTVGVSGGIPRPVFSYRYNTQLGGLDNIQIGSSAYPPNRVLHPATFVPGGSNGTFYANPWRVNQIAFPASTAMFQDDFQIQENIDSSSSTMYGIYARAGEFLINGHQVCRDGNTPGPVHRRVIGGTPQLKGATAQTTPSVAGINNYSLVDGSVQAVNVNFKYQYNRSPNTGNVVDGIGWDPSAAP